MRCRLALRFLVLSSMSVSPGFVPTVLRKAVVRALLALAVLVTPVAKAQLSLPPDYAWRQLSPSGEPTSSVTFQWRIDPRGEWVVFIGDVESAGAEAVYSLRRNGAELHRLSPYAPTGTILRLELSPDGRRVVYSGALETNGRVEVWSAPLAGTPAAAVKLNLPVIGEGVTSFSVGDSGDRIAYAAETVSGWGFWTVPVAGPAAAGVNVAPPLAAGEIPYFGFVLGDPSRALLFVYDTVAPALNLWSAPAAGPAAAGLYLLSSNPEGCTAFPAAVSSVTRRIAYTFTCDSPVGDRTNQLWSMPFEGPEGAEVSLAGSFVQGGAIGSTSSSADGSRIVFTADKLIDEKQELWSVPFTGPAGELVRLNPSLIASGDVTAFDISPDGARVAYIADATTNETFRPWSVPIAGPSTLAEPLVTGATAANADVTNLDFAPDSATIVFRGDLSQDQRFDLYAAPADGSGGREQITNDSGIPGPDRSTGLLWRLHPDGRRVVFTVDQDAPSDQRRLYEQRLQPRYVQDARLNGEPVAGGRISSFEVFPDSAGTLYYSDELVDGRFHLFTVDSRIFGDGFEEGTTVAWADAP